jgi:hypothetical protein
VRPAHGLQEGDGGAFDEGLLGVLAHGLLPIILPILGVIT